ncbi:hypothetical protein [Schauerella aestuarii]|uniref:hypothetical protein n=1 Tax=Schauerella aestuarii TaxID=2511204 RepID=UPI001368C5B4|nr:hypothetical protein [Achromobacter aestuarii]MYZ41416.1 hypothetical protein [Achromobacter aestuarii]
MPDIVARGGLPGNVAANKRYKDMGDGTYAEVVALGGKGGLVAVCLYNMATNGDVFAADSQTAYTYDESGVNITSITKTTFDGISYKQTWTRDAMSQLSLKSGWVRQP